MPCFGRTSMLIVLRSSSTQQWYRLSLFLPKVQQFLKYQYVLLYILANFDRGSRLLFLFVFSVDSFEKDFPYLVIATSKNNVFKLGR
jgi:hypothetical protein